VGAIVYYLWGCALQFVILEHPKQLNPQTYFDLTLPRFADSPSPIPARTATISSVRDTPPLPPSAPPPPPLLPPSISVIPRIPSRSRRRQQLRRQRRRLHVLVFLLGVCCRQLHHPLGFNVRAHVPGRLHHTLRLCSQLDIPRVLSLGVPRVAGPFLLRQLPPPPPPPPLPKKSP
jgi:hypothetical protein